MSNEKYNINISIDESSIQLCIEDRFYRIVNSSNSKDEFQMVGMQIMDMIDSLDDILRFREVKVTRLDDVMKRKMTAFSQLLMNSVLPKRNDTQLEKFVKTKVAQQTFKAISMRQNDIQEKKVTRTISVCEKEQEERIKHKNKVIDYTDDAQLEEAVQKLYGDKVVSSIATVAKPVEKKTIDIKAEIKKSLKVIEQKEQSEKIVKKEETPKETIAKAIKDETKPKQEYTFDQQYLIDLYIKNFGKIKVSRDKFKQQVKTNRYTKLFGTYTEYVAAVLA